MFICKMGLDVFRSGAGWCGAGVGWGGVGGRVSGRAGGLVGGGGGVVSGAGSGQQLADKWRGDERLVTSSSVPREKLSRRVEHRHD